MKTMRAGMAAALAMTAVLWMMPFGEAQQGSPFPQQSSGGSGGQTSTPSSQGRVPSLPGDDSMSDAATKTLAKRASSINEARQKQIVADTAKLLILAQELKADVDKSSKDTLSIDVIKRADEIERLARAVKEKMKN